MNDPLRVILVIFGLALGSWGFLLLTANFIPWVLAALALFILGIVVWESWPRRQR